MHCVQELFETLSALSGTTVLRDVHLANYTRFGIGGPADLFAETSDSGRFIDAWRIAHASGLDTVVIGGGTNLIVSDAGFRGVVLKLSNPEIRAERETVHVEGGASLQALVDFTVDAGLKGLETMTGIPGSAGAAVYGNAGAYGHSIAERISRVRFFDGVEIREFNNGQCEFRYRESVFKRHKEWIIFSAELAMERGDTAALRETADKILGIRNKKYPPTMKCAGSIFKNFLLADLPARVVNEIPANVIIEGKVPSAWFLEQVGAKGMRAGDIHVADYHANLIYNAGQGTALDLVGIIAELKQRVEKRWGIPLEEEVQYVGFTPVPAPPIGAPPVDTKDDTKEAVTI
jgi:UDP-N-acetylmuramate dehydrogenase